MAVPVPVPVGGEDPETNDVILARGAAEAGTGGVRAAGSIGPLYWDAAVASMLVPISIPVRAFHGRMVSTW